MAFLPEIWPAWAGRNRVFIDRQTATRQSCYYQEMGKDTFKFFLLEMD